MSGLIARDLLTPSSWGQLVERTATTRMCESDVVIWQNADMNIYTPLISVDDRVVTASRIQSGKESFRGLSPEQVAAVEAGETVCIRCNNGPRAIVEVFDGFATRTFEGSIASVPNLGRLDTDAEKMAALEVWAAGK